MRRCTIKDSINIAPICQSIIRLPEKIKTYLSTFFYNFIIIIPDVAYCI